jgi:uncharacterized protein
MLFRMLMTFAVLLCLDFYAFEAVKTITRDSSQPVKQLVTWVYWAIPVGLIGFMLLGAIGGIELSKPTAAIFRGAIFMVYLGKFVIAITLFGGDLYRGITLGATKLFAEQPYLPSRSKFLATTSLFLGLVPAVTLTYGILKNKYNYRIHRHKIAVKGLPKAMEGLRMVQISDIHSGTFTESEPLKKAIELINGENPDLVFFTGDLINSRADEMKPLMHVFDKIVSKHGIFSILGNHDYGDYDRWETPALKAQNFDNLVATHQKLGWQLLRNEHRVIDILGGKLGLIGVENYSTMAQFPKYGDLGIATAGMPATDFRVLLSHDPTHWSAKVEGKTDINLTLSGHTHGFQFGIEIPGYFRWSPSQYAYKQWAGLYKSAEQYIYVNRGFGMLGYPGRVGILPEITVLELVSV